MSMQTQFVSAAPRPSRTQPVPYGFFIVNHGGNMAWLTKRLFPALAQSLYASYERSENESAVLGRIQDFMNADPAPWFSRVEIETVNRCNGDCIFCPVNRTSDPRSSCVMSEALFFELLRQLADIDYRGMLGLYSNNEPLLDDRLADLAAQTRKALPNATLELRTNGNLLEMEILLALLPHFDRIIVNNYHDRPAVREHLRDIQDFCGSCEGLWLLRDRTVEIHLRDFRDPLLINGCSGGVRHPRPKQSFSPCSLPFSQIVIRPDGKVGLCCRDTTGKTTLGDLTCQSLADVWFGDACNDLRQRMATGGRKEIPLCQWCCDTVGKPH